MMKTSAIGFLGLLASCVGSINGGGAGPGGGQEGGSATGGRGGPAPGGSTPGSPTSAPGGLSGSCKDQQPGVPDPPLRRLTATQYANSVRDIVAFALKDEKLTTAALAELKPALDDVPADRRIQIGDSLTFRRLAQDIQQLWVEKTYEVARQVGALLTRPERFARLVPCAATAGANAATCIDGFIRSFGERALRAPVQDDQLALFRKIYGDTTRIDPAAFADLVGLFLTAPQFLYLMEQGQAPVSGRAGVFRLRPEELAARLSYHFWDTPPDDALSAAARSGGLLTPDGFRREVDRLLGDSRARPVFESFYTEWLDLEDLPALDNFKAEKDFQAFAGADLPKPTLRASMTAELLDLTRHFSWTKPGTFDDLLTTELAFVRSMDLAKIYGLAAPWDGAGTPPAFATGSRPGVLTRAALLANGEVKTRPILRGVRVRTEVLCDELPPAPGNAGEVADAARGKLPPNASSRQEAAFLSEASGCGGACHTVLINPLGYALEGYDALGRIRREEPIFSKTTGAVVTRVPVDTSAVPRVTADDARTVRGAAELVRLIQESGKAHACFARKYFRFALGRVEDPAKDACLLDGLTKALQEKRTLAEAFKIPALAPAFQERNFGGLP